MLAALAFTCLTTQAAITLDTNLPNGAVGQPYNSQLNSSGGSGPYTFAINGGNLPGGLSLATSGTIVGTPQHAGHYNFSVRTTDALQETVLTRLTLRITGSSGLRITNTALGLGRINRAYDQALTAQGGASPYSWDLLFGSGSLPPGIHLTAQGRLQGTPTMGGVYPITLRVTDASGNSYRHDVELLVEAPTLTINNTSLAGASNNVPYSQGLSAFGGTAPYSFSLLSGNLPPGLTLSPGGLLSGTPTSNGMYNFVVRATDAASGTAQANFTVVVSGTGPRIIITSLPVGTMNSPFNATLNGQGGMPPYNFSVLTGSLPAGLTLNQNGTISGTPTASGLFPVTVRMGDAGSQSSQSDIFIRVNSGAFNVTSTGAQDGFVGNAYNFNFNSTGGMSPTIYTLLSGALPTGLSLNPAGSISGNPTAAGTYSFVIRATDATQATSQVRLTIRILSTTLMLSQAGLANARLGQFYSSTLSASGGAAPYNFNLVTGTLPAGLTLSGNGNISGTPTAAGIYQLTYRVIDSNNRSAESTLALYVAGGPFNISPLTLPSGQVNQSYQQVFSATGGMAPYNYQVSMGSVPTGLLLSPTGILSGTLTQNTNGAFTVRVSDASGASSLISYLFNVNPAGMSLSSNVAATGSVGQLYTSRLTASGASSYTLDSGALPPGLTLASDGTLSGTPTTNGTFLFTVRAAGPGTSAALFSQSIVIASDQLGFTTTTLLAIVVNMPYTATLTGVNGSSPYTFSIIGGSLPAGISFASSGAFSGTTAAVGSYPLSVRIEDSMGSTATGSVTLTVGNASALSISTSALPTGRRGIAYSSMIMAAGGIAPYTFSLVNGNLPPGLILSVAGLIAGTPTADGATTFTLRARDSSGNEVQKTFIITVGSSTLAFTSNQLSNGITGRHYQSSFGATGGQAPYTYTLLSGSLPAGLSLSSTGFLSGTPTTGGSSSFVVRLVDAANNAVQQNFTVTVGTSDFGFITANLPTAYVGQNYRNSLAAFAGTQPFTFTLLNGALPAGLTLGSNGLITGVPTTAGQSTATFRVTDATGAMADNTIVIATIQSTATFGFTSIPNGVVGQPYRFSPTANGSTSAYILGGLPPGISATRIGDLAGVPTQVGTFYVTIRTQDSTGASAVSTFPFTVDAAGFRINGMTLPNGRLNQPYSQTFTSSDGTGATVYTVQSGTLPAGLTLSPAGILSGTPTALGNFTFTVRGVDAGSASTSSTFTLIVEEAGVAFDTNTLPSVTVNQPYNQTLALSGGTAPYTVSLASGTLPAGLMISQSGVISGTPTASGNFPFMLRVTDSMGQTSTSSFLIGVGVAGAPSLTAVVSAANYASNGVAPGEIVILYGTTLGPANLVSASVSNNMFGTTLSGTRVTFDGTPAPVIYTSGSQVAVVAPFNLTGKTSTVVVVESLGVSAAAIQIPVRTARPAIFTANASGTGAGAILNQDSSVNTAANPANAQSIVSIYATGLGQTNPASVDGQISMGQSTFATPLTATINGQTAEVLYAGGAPGLIPGLAQINLRLPANMMSGANTIQLTMGGVTTTGTVTVFVR